MSLEPEIQLLPNGDILAPVQEGGEWHVQRVAPEDHEYADWLAIVQAKNKRSSPFERVRRFLLAAAIVAFFFIVLLAVITVRV